MRGGNAARNAARVGGGTHGGSGGSPVATPFVVIPAVDVLGGRAVRLQRGDFDRVQIDAGPPEALVERMAGSGAALIHVVDLDGARAGRTNPPLVARLVRASGGADLQVGGGIRSVRDAHRLLDAGASRVVVGTALFTRPDAVRRWVDALGGRLVAALDVRGSDVAAHAWTASAGVGLDDALARCADAGVARLMCTAIERDGTLAGPDLPLYGRILAQAAMPVIASGGIRSLADTSDLARLGLEGCVVGRALLNEGSDRLAGAIAAR